MSGCGTWLSALPLWQDTRCQVLGLGQQLLARPQLQLRRGSPADTTARRALAGGHCSGEGEPSPAGRHCLAPLPSVPRGASRTFHSMHRHRCYPPSSERCSQLGWQLNPECLSQTLTDLVLPSDSGRQWHKQQGDSVEPFNRQPFCSKNKHVLLILEVRPTLIGTNLDNTNLPSHRWDQAHLLTYIYSSKHSYMFSTPILSLKNKPRPSGDKQSVIGICTYIVFASEEGVDKTMYWYTSVPLLFFGIYFLKL